MACVRDFTNRAEAVERGDPEGGGEIAVGTAARQVVMAEPPGLQKQGKIEWDATNV